MKSKKNAIDSSPNSNKEENRVSNLSEDVLFQIFSYVDTSTACRTSALSKHWYRRSVWTMLPDLSFRYWDPLYLRDNYPGFKEFVNKALDSRKGKHIRRFHLCCYSRSFRPSDMKKWISDAIQCDAKEINIELIINSWYPRQWCHEIELPLALPLAVFSSATLTTLKLHGHTNIYVTNLPAWFPKLKILDLTLPNRWCRSNNAKRLVNSFLSSCPVLEEFYVNGNWNVMGVIRAPDTLKKLSVHVDCLGGDLFEIDAPSLEFFSLQHFYLVRYMIKNLNNVVEARLSILFQPISERSCLFDLFRALSNVKYLYLNIQYRDHNGLPVVNRNLLADDCDDRLRQFPNLLRLHLDGSSNMDLLPSLKSPMLETLIIQVKGPRNKLQLNSFCVRSPQEKQRFAEVYKHLCCEWDNTRLLRN